MTGVPSAVLRAWEKRYGIPAPRRTDTDYRLYSDGDVAMIRRMGALRATGLVASEAARIVLSEQPSASTAPQVGEASVERLLVAARKMDGAAIDQCLASLVTFGNAKEAFDRVIGPVLRAVGELWQAQEISEAEEHLLSEHISFVLRSWLTVARPSVGAKVALLACHADELHTIPAYGVALRWASLGWDPIVLGARTSPAALRQAVERLSPGVVGLSITTPIDGAGAKLLPEYATAVGRVPWLVGGGASAVVADEVRVLGGLTGEESVQFLAHEPRSLVAPSGAGSRR